MYVLDTCVISDFVKGDKTTLAKIKTINPSKIYISPITLMEIYYGLYLNPAVRLKIEPLITDFLTVISILPYAKNEAMKTAEIRSYLKQNGKQIGAYDLLIAATALSHNLVLVTSNLSEFERVKELKLENWRSLN